MQRFKQLHLIRQLLAAALVGASLSIPHAAASLGGQPPARHIKAEAKQKPARGVQTTRTATPSTFASVQATPVISRFDDGASIADGEKDMQICGTDLISATNVLFNGQHSAGLYEWSADPAGSADGCWYTTVPIADPPDAVNGPLVIVASNGVATATTDFTAESFVSSTLEYNRAWLPDGKYYVLTGPYLGTATEVSLDDAPVSFQSANLIRLLIPVLNFDTLTHTLAITTPDGVYTDSVTFLRPMLTNMIPPDKDGSFEITDLYADASVGATHNAYRTRNGMLLPGNDFIATYYTYVDTGNTLSATTLADSNILVTSTLIGPNQVYASGTFTSATTTRAIQWSSVGSIQPNSQEYYVTGHVHGYGRSWRAQAAHTPG